MEPTLCSTDRICQEDTDLRVVLQQLIEAHGMPAVKQVFRSIEAANPVKNTRPRGRPRGPAINDLPALQEAAAIWRQQGSGWVWPALTAVAKSLRGEPRSTTRRLFYRLQETGPDSVEKFVRAGIDDFCAASHRNFVRALGQAKINKTNVQLTYTLEEYQEFNEFIPLYRNWFTITMRDRIPEPNPDDVEYLANLQNELTDVLNYIAHDLPVVRTKKEVIKLMFKSEKYYNLVDNIGFLQMDLLGYQDWYIHVGDYVKEESLEKLLDLNDVFMRLLRLKMTLDT